jgi:NTP pyrophosphatase (non-canonical NTP hydrolase)
VKTGILIANKELDKAIAVHLIHHGNRSYNILVDRLIEEMSELIQALCKERRGRDVAENIEEEISDVILQLEFLCSYRIISKARINKRISSKSKRVVKALHKGKE